MDQLILAFGFGFLLFLAVSSLFVRGKVREVARKYSEKRANCNITGSQLVERIIGGEDLPEAKIRGLDSYPGGGSFSGQGLIRVPEPDGNSLHGLTVAAHETAHLRQEKGRYAFFVLRGKYLEVAGSLISYLIPVNLVLGLVFYPPLAYLAAGLFCALVVLVFLETIIEVDASRKAIGYLKNYAEVREEELDQVKKILIWAILSRISYFTGGYVALFIMDEKR
jgi:Zn-dependent membrane protease YugP